MASICRYKCLNPQCPGPGNKNYTNIFGAMNNDAKCPACGTLKLENWGAGSSLGWQKIVAANVHTHDMSAFKRTNDSIQQMADQGGI